MEDRKKFVHLHLHTENSINDATIKPAALAKRLKELGMNKVAITDHGVMFNTPKIYKELKAHGVEMIIGSEVYVAPRSKNMKQAKIDDANYHLVLLCETDEGYQNLLKIVSKASLDGMYYKPRTDKHFLRNHSKGLIAISACLGGELLRTLTKEGYDKAKETAMMYRDIFGPDNYFIEIQDHGMHEQWETNKDLIKLARELNIGLVATNDCHYIYKEQAGSHDVLMAIQAGVPITSEKRKKYPTNEFYVKSAEEMWEIFKHTPDALENTVKIADRCNVKYEFGVNKLPPFDTPSDYAGTNKDFLTDMVYEGLRWRYGDPIPQEAKDRADYEISTAENMGFVNYFLITWDFFRFCREGTENYGEPKREDWTPILTGPGRGCFLPNQSVYMHDGNVRNIQDIEIGDVVVGECGPNKVYAKFEYDVNEDMTDIQVGGEHIKCTNDHKILAIQSNYCDNPTEKNTFCNSWCRKFKTCRYKKEKNKPRYIEASKLKRGDYLVYPSVNSFKSDSVNEIDLSYYSDESCLISNDYIETKNPLNHKTSSKINRYIKIDDDFALFAGLYIGNGWSRYNKDKRRYDFGISLNQNQYDKYSQFIIDYISRLGESIKSSVRWNEKRTCANIVFGNKTISKFLKDEFGYNASNKRIPNFVQLNYINLLVGLFGTDGHVPNTAKITYSTTSEVLAKQIRLMLLNNGIYSSLVFRKQTREGWSKEIKVQLSSHEASKLYRILDKPGVFKSSGRAETTFGDGRYIYKRIYEVSSFHYEGKVYDLGVENNPSYNVEGAIVHNSGAGSIMLYALGITHICPLEYNLLFERFLDPSRISMPDIDSDFEYERRNEVIDYTIRKYGRECVSQIITFNTLAAKAATRAVGRALDYPIPEYDKWSKMIPKNPGITIRQAFEQNPDLKAEYETNPRCQKLFNIAMDLEGLPTSVGTNACGVLITDKRGVEAHVPMWENKSGVVATFDKDILDSIGLLKMDFLGLRTLGVIRETVDNVYRNHGIKIDVDELYKVPTLEPLKLVREGKTSGIFQLESPGMTAFMKELKPESIDDIIAGISLYRPGPMDEIPRFINNKRNPDQIRYPLKGMAEILDETYGVLTYQGATCFCI